MFVTRRGIVALAVASSLLSTGCREEAPTPEVLPRPVRYQVVESSQMSASRTFSGAAQSGLETQLSFRVSGNVETLAVHVGDTVEEGDLIAQLDTSDYEVQSQAASAETSAARARERSAEADYDRIRALYESGNASRSDLDAARAAAESASASVRAARQQVQRARDQIGYCSLTSPVAGQIAAANVEVNENVAAGQVVVVLTSGAEEELEVEVAVPETVITQIEQGMTGSVTFNALHGQTFQATVTEVGVASGAMATTFPVTLRLDSPDPGVRPGMAAEVTFSFGNEDGEPRYFLPPHAVAEDQQGRFVYLVDPATEEGLGIIRRQPVSIGELDGRGLEVAEGVEDGDRVVTAGLSSISDEMTVRLLGPQGR